MGLPDSLQDSFISRKQRPRCVVAPDGVRILGDLSRTVDAPGPVSTGPLAPVKTAVRVWHAPPIIDVQLGREPRFRPCGMDSHGSTSRMAGGGLVLHGLREAEEISTD